MKSDFLIAITQIAAEKNLPKEVVLQAVETALISAYKKDSEVTGNIVVRIDRNTGNVHVFAQKAVVAEVEDERVDISVKEARRIKPDAQLGDILEFEVMPASSGRIAALRRRQRPLQCQSVQALLDDPGRRAGPSGVCDHPRLLGGCPRPCRRHS